MSRLTKILAIAFVVSAALNVFFVGFWAARSVHRWHGQRDVSAPDMHERGAARQAVMTAREKARDALVAEPFQAEAFEGALANLRTQSGEAQLAFHRSLVLRVRGMSQKERQRLAESRLFTGPDAAGAPAAR